MMWEMQHRGRAFWITKCYPSVDSKSIWLQLLWGSGGGVDSTEMGTVEPSPYMKINQEILADTQLNLTKHPMSGGVVVGPTILRKKIAGPHGRRFGAWRGGAVKGGGGVLGPH